MSEPKAINAAEARRLADLAQAGRAGTGLMRGEDREAMERIFSEVRRAAEGGARRTRVAIFANVDTYLLLSRLLERGFAAQICANEPTGLGILVKW